MTSSTAVKCPACNGFGYKIHIGLNKSGEIDGNPLTCSFCNGSQVALLTQEGKYIPIMKKEYRCIKCNKLLGKFSDNSEFEIICPKCKTINIKDREPSSTSS